MPKSERPEKKEMTFLDHLLELRRRIIISLISLLAGTVLCFALYEFIFSIFFRPLAGLADQGPLASALFINTIFEGFLIRMKISLLAGLILSFPVHLYNLIKFVFPGLTGKEKQVIRISLLASFVLITLSVYYSYFKLIPLSIKFLTGAGFVPERVGLLLNYGKNIFYIFQFMIISLVVFQFPVVLELCLIMNLVKRRSLLRMSRYVILVIFILSAVLTPPDFISQLGVALPLVLLFFLTLLIAKIFRFGEG